MKPFLLTSCFLVFFVAKSSAQMPIREVCFTGLKKTKEGYLNRFIETRAGQDLKHETIEEDLQRLKNLNAVADGTFTIDSTETEATVHFQIQEALTFFPIVNFGGVRGNFWFQLGFVDDNWRGQGQKLAAFYQNNDRRHNFNVFYKIPHLNSSRWGVSGSVFRWASVEPLYFGDETVYYNYDNLSFGLSGLYEKKRNSIFELGATYFTETYQKNSRHEGTQTPGPEDFEQPKLLAKFIHYYSGIDYHFFYLKGIDNQLTFQTVYNFLDESWFYLFQNDTRFFRRISPKQNFAARFRLGISTNNSTPFAPFVLDSYVNIRGSGNRIERGTGAAILNLELRQTVYDRKRSKVGGQVVLFSDLGAWRKPGGKLEDLVSGRGVRHFVGGGVRLIYKKAFNAILRFDYGIDVRNPGHRGAVIGIGQYF